MGPSHVRVIKTHRAMPLHAVVSWKRSPESNLMVVIHPRVLQHVPQEPRLYGVNSTGEIKEHDSHRAPRLLCVSKTPVHSNAKLKGELTIELNRGQR